MKESGDEQLRSTQNELENASYLVEDLRKENKAARNEHDAALKVNVGLNEKLKNADETIAALEEKVSKKIQDGLYQGHLKIETEKKSQLTMAERKLSTQERVRRRAKEELLEGLPASVSRSRSRSRSRSPSPPLKVSALSVGKSERSQGLGLAPTHRTRNKSLESVVDSALKESEESTTIPDPDLDLDLDLGRDKGRMGMGAAREGHVTALWNDPARLRWAWGTYSGLVAASRALKYGGQVFMDRREAEVWLTP